MVSIRSGGGGGGWVVLRGRGVATGRRPLVPPLAPPLVLKEHGTAAAGISVTVIVGIIVTGIVSASLPQHTESNQLI